MLQRKLEFYLKVNLKRPKNTHLKAQTRNIVFTWKKSQKKVKSKFQQIYQDIILWLAKKQLKELNNPSKSDVLACTATWYNGFNHF